MTVPVLWRGTTADGEDWVLADQQDGFVLRLGNDEILVPAAEAGRIAVNRRLWRTTVTVVGASERAGPLRGLTRAEGRRLQVRVQQVLTESAIAWSERVTAAVESARRGRRWITEEEVTAYLAALPRTDLLTASVATSGRDTPSLHLTEDGLRRLVRAINEEVVTEIVRSHRRFFDTVESSPLTDEQVRAVVTYDNRVNVIAAAGSGKTSVMVARAAYAVARGLARPEEILLLAFNKDAAEELRTRIRTRFAAAGLPGDGLVATTFHAFGLKVIGHATGRKPTVAPWVTDGDELAVLSEIVADRRAADPRFGYRWDMFRLLLARADAAAEAAVADAWDPDHRRAGLRTMAGEVVKSQGERVLADWLYLHGVRYEYERPYVHDTADPEHRQYHPDFYYPDIDVWHEHWGLDADGNPHPTWTDYAAGMAWKKQLHETHGTTLLETTWAGVTEGGDLPRLERELTGHGIRLSWDPDRPAARGVRVTTDADMLRLVRTFMVHVKANSLDREELQRRVAAGRVRNRVRARAFLDLYWPIHAAWQSRLDSAGMVDFEDMLVLAADHLEAGRFESPYRLVMVDELQDASRARARLARALVARPGRHLLAVGDDWQSINRFAGADLSVVTGFHDYFGVGPDLHLTRTFRCHQSITDAAARFVVKNPAQHPKNVVSVNARPVDPAAQEGVMLRTVSGAAEVPHAIADFLAGLTVGDGRGHGAPVSVDVLGRYRQDAGLMPRGRFPGIRLDFRTIHSAKGLEADYVVVPNLSNGTYGFPSTIADDPVLALAMAAEDTYPHAEERRLFYVALTRARRGVLLICPEHNPSPFVTELVQDGLVRDVGPLRVATPCPECRAGVMRRRSSRYGAFWGCSTFPRCRYTSNTLPGAGLPTTGLMASPFSTAVRKESSS